MLDKDIIQINQMCKHGRGAVIIEHTGGAFAPFTAKVSYQPENRECHEAYYKHKGDFHSSAYVEILFQERWYQVKGSLGLSAGGNTVEEAVTNLKQLVQALYDRDAELEMAKVQLRFKERTRE